MKLFFRNHKQLLLLLSPFLMALFFWIIYLLLPKPEKLTAPSSVSDVRIGKTTASQVATLPNIVNKTALPNGKTAFDVKTGYAIRGDQIITDSKTTVFVRKRVSSDDKNQTLGVYTAQLGQPEEEIMGSKHYGEAATLFLYASKGIAILGNKHSGEVFETQTFIPTNVENYKTLYGQDILPPVQKLGD